MALDEFSLKPAARKIREAEPTDRRIAATLDDIATALEAIAKELRNKK